MKKKTTETLAILKYTVIHVIKYHTLLLRPFSNGGKRNGQRSNARSTVSYEQSKRSAEVCLSRSLFCQRKNEYRIKPRRHKQRTTPQINTYVKVKAGPNYCRTALLHKATTALAQMPTDCTLNLRLDKEIYPLRASASIKDRLYNIICWNLGSRRG